MSLDIEQKIDTRKCEQVRDWLKRRKHPEEVADRFDIVPSTVRHHGYGHCACVTNVAPADPMSERIGPDDCIDIRQRAKDEEEYADIADDHNVTRHTVGKHARGQCGHEVDEPPKESDGIGKNSTVSAQTCYNANMLYWEENLHLDQIMDVVRENVDDPPTEKAVKHHIYNDCKHWDDETG